MAATTSQSVLCNAALASGLLSQQQIDDAVAGLAARNTGSAVAAEPITDEVARSALGRPRLSESLAGRAA